MKPILVYIPTETEEEAKKIGEHLVKNRFASCANIIPKIHSFYWWEGKVQSGDEAVLMVKTFDTNYEKLEKEVRKLHSYSVPAIIAIPAEKINEDYLQWSKNECT